METTTKTFWLPEKASTFAEFVDPAFNLYYWVSLFFFVLITGGIVIFVAKYMRRHPDQLAESQLTHSTFLETLWTAVPLVLVMMFFVIGMKGYLKMRIAPGNAMSVNVIGQKWSWSFRYPQGFINDTLVVPVHQPVKLVMTSTDVIHSFFVPAFRQKADVIPNRYHTMWFEATKTGTFPVECTQYCGTNHSYMWTAVKVVSDADYQTWLAAAADPSKGKTPVEYGKELYTKRGCNACHSLDGARLVGPSWKGIWNKQEKMVGGASVLVDENYLRESMLEPMAKVVDSYAPVMPTYKGVLGDKEVESIIAYIQSLK
jgi:cytochrome c oxidase subunit II